MNIIVTDLEGTLTTGSSWKGIRSFYKEHYSAWRYQRFFLPWIPLYIMVYAGLLNRRVAMMNWMQAEVKLFQNMSLVDFQKMAEWVVDEVMWPSRRMDVLEELEQKHQAGAKLALVSSAYQPIVDVFASRMDAIPIGSQLITKAGQIQGLVDPLNAYEYKADYIRKVFDEPISAAYGDTLSDLPMLEMSQNPVAVYPDKEMRQVAMQRGWRIIPEGDVD